MRWQCRSPLGTRIDKIQPFELPFQFNSIITRDVKVVEWNQNQLIRSLFSIGNKKWLIKDIWERYRWNPWRSISNKINYWKLQNLFGIICQSLKSKPGKLVRVNPVKTQHLRWKILTECHAAQRANFSEKVHKPSLGVNVINFQLNVFNVCLESLRPQN